MSSDLEGATIGEEIDDILKKYFIIDYRTKGYRRYRGVMLPACHSKHAERIENFEVRDDDIWVMSFPKTGTTWTQEMVWCIVNTCDYEGAKEMLQQRFPFFEHSSLLDFDEVLPSGPSLVLPPFILDSVSFVDNIKEQRFIKTHLSWNLLPKQIRNLQKKPKIIYVCRNAKDTCISYYHHCQVMEGYKGDFDTFCKLFLEDSLNFSPFWSHISGFWSKKNLPNVLFITYEDMRKDLASVVRRTGDFLSKELTDEQVDSLCDHLSFKSMKNNPSVNYEAVIEVIGEFCSVPEDAKFIRQGTGGEWKGKMNKETIKRFDDWSNENIKQLGLDIWKE